MQNMRKVGNVASNQIYNPGNKKPPVPIDADEADSAMERFIREKYIHNVADQSSKPRSPISDEGTPPPLPPKNSKFGFRAAFSRSRTMSDKSLNAYTPSSPPLTNKPSKLFGATVDYDAPDETDKKLAKLRDMGFQNSQRNSIVLKGVSGDMDRAVEALVRLGEGDGPPPAPPKEKTLRATRSLTPMMPNSSGYTGGLNVVKRSETDRPTSSSTTSTNPFDMLNRAQPQTAHSTGSLQSTNPYNAPTNPFGHMSAQSSPIDQAFQNLTISGQQTGVSPNGTGFSLPMPPRPQIYGHSAPASPQPQQGLGLSNNAGYSFNTQQNSLQPQPTGYNPYFSQPVNAMQQQQQPQYPAQHGIALNTNYMGGQIASNPYVRSPTRIASPPPLAQISETATFSTSPMPLASPTNPFFTGQPNMPSPGIQQQQQQYMQPQPQQQYMQPQQQMYQPQQQNMQQQQQMYQQQQQMYQQQPQQQTQQFAQQPQQQQGFQPQQMYQPQQTYQQYYAPRHDKASIMALYGQSPKPQLQAQAQSIPENQAVDAFAAPNMAAGFQQPRSVSQPLPGTNPFAASMQQASTATAAGSVDAYKTGRQVSRESMNLGMDMAWTNNGRHSPDAFASLSARHV